MLEESGLLHDEPVKLFPNIQTLLTKTHTPTSSSHSKTTNVTAKRVPCVVKGGKQVKSGSTTSSPSISSNNNRTQMNRKEPPEDSEVQYYTITNNRSFSYLTCYELITAWHLVKNIQIL